MQFNFKIDKGMYEKQIQEAFENKFKSAALSEIQWFFGTKTEITTSGIKLNKNPGLKEIEDIITKKFCDPKFVADAEKFIEDNWRSIFEQCLTKALQHKANAMSFSKAKKTHVYMGDLNTNDEQPLALNTIKHTKGNDDTSTQSGY